MTAALSVVVGVWAWATLAGVFVWVLAATRKIVRGK